MEINFPTAAFLAGLKAPNQIMYSIIQDNGVPVVIHKYTQHPQKSANIPPWSTQAQVSGTNQLKENHQQHSSVVEANQVNLK